VLAYSRCSANVPLQTQAHTALKAVWVTKCSQSEGEENWQPISSLSSFHSERGTHWPESRTVTDVEDRQPNASLPHGVSKKCEHRVA
jgi:hypothetical protein